MANIPAINTIPSISTPLVDSNSNMSATWHEYFRKFINNTIQVENTVTPVVNTVTAGPGLVETVGSVSGDIILSVEAGPGLVANASNLTIDITALNAVQGTLSQEIMVSDPANNNTVSKTTLNSIVSLNSVTIDGTPNEITAVVNPSSGVITLSLPNNIVVPGTAMTLPRGSIGAATAGRIQYNTVSGKMEFDNSTSWLPFGTCPATNISRCIPVFTGTNNCNFVDSTVPIDVNGNISPSGVIITKVNASEASNAVTASGSAGVITTSSLTTAAAGSYAITWTNTKIAATSVVHLTIMGGTNTTENITLKATAGSGTSTLTIYNNAASTALNGTILIGYQII